MYKTLTSLFFCDKLTKIQKKKLETLLNTLRESSQLDIFALIGLLVGLIAQLLYIYAIVFLGAKPAISTLLLWVMLASLLFWGQLQTGHVFPQTAVYAFTDPLILIFAFFVGHWSKYEKEDWIALGLGICGGSVLFFYPEDSGIGLCAIIFAVGVANIPIIKNLKSNPYAENPFTWICFMVAGLFSLLSGIFYFNTYWDLLTPLAYTLLSIPILVLLYWGRFVYSLHIIQPIED